MKLRNKKTGEIVDFTEGFIKDTYNGEYIQIKPVAISNKEGYLYHSLAELNEEWEDYAGREDYYWYIGSDGAICGRGFRLRKETETDRMRYRVGNCFETKEEAERAVEKLKALKRLKDKGFVWQGWEEGSMGNGMCVVICQIPEDNWETDVVEDLVLLFGDEE